MPEERIIAVDALSGDHENGPLEVVMGAIEAAQEAHINIVLVGAHEQIAELVKEVTGKTRSLPHGVTMQNAGSVIGQHDHPARSFVRQKDSSTCRAIDLVASGEAHAAVSPGNTGAVVLAAKKKLGLVDGLGMPAVGSPVITKNGKPSFMIDMGAIAEPTAEHLVQFALMGDAYARKYLRAGNARVGLMNLGTEEHKGGPVLRSALKHLMALSEKGRLNFIGNIEGGDPFTGEVNVTAGKSETLNAVLKSAKAVLQLFAATLKEEIVRDWRGKLGAKMLGPHFQSIKGRLNYNQFGGAPLLGLKKGSVIVAHGSSNAESIKNAVLLGAKIDPECVSETMGTAIADAHAEMEGE